MEFGNWYNEFRQSAKKINLTESQIYELALDLETGSTIKEVKEKIKNYRRQSE